MAPQPDPSTMGPDNHPTFPGSGYLYQDWAPSHLYQAPGATDLLDVPAFEYETIESINWQLQNERPDNASSMSSTYSMVSIRIGMIQTGILQAHNDLGDWSSPEAKEAFRQRVSESYWDLHHINERVEQVRAGLSDLATVMSNGMTDMQELYDDYVGTMSRWDTALELDRTENLERMRRGGRVPQPAKWPKTIAVERDSPAGQVNDEGGQLFNNEAPSRDAYKAKWDELARAKRDQIAGTYVDAVTSLGGSFPKLRVLDARPHPEIATSGTDLPPAVTGGPPPGGPGPGAPPPAGPATLSAMSADTAPTGPAFMTLSMMPDGPAANDVGNGNSPGEAPPPPPVGDPNGAVGDPTDPGAAADPADPGAPADTTAPAPLAPAAPAPPTGLGANPSAPPGLLPSRLGGSQALTAGGQGQVPPGPSTLNPWAHQQGMSNGLLSASPDGFGAITPQPPDSVITSPASAELTGPAPGMSTMSTDGPPGAGSAAPGMGVPPMGMPPGMGGSPGAPTRQQPQRAGEAANQGAPGAPGMPAALPPAFTPPSLGGPPVLGDPQQRRSRRRPGGAAEAPPVAGRGARAGGTGGGTPPILTNQRYAGPRRTYTEQRQADRQARKDRAKRFAELLKSHFAKGLPDRSAPVLDSRTTAVGGNARVTEVPAALQARQPTPGVVDRHARPERPADRTSRRALPGRAPATPERPTTDQAAWEVETPGGPVIAGEQPHRPGGPAAPALGGG